MGAGDAGAEATASVNNPTSYDDTGMRTDIQNQPVTAVSHAADSGQSSAARLFANKSATAEPQPVAANSQSTVNNAGTAAEAQVPRLSYPSRTGIDPYIIFHLII